MKTWAGCDKFYSPPAGIPPLVKEVNIMVFKPLGAVACAAAGVLLVTSCVEQPRKMTGKEKEDLFLGGYEKMKKEGGCKWLSDNRKLRPWTTEDVQWINGVWLPKMLAAGWKYWAVVEPETALGNLSMRNFLGFYAEKGLEVQIFHSVEAAKEWMRSVD